MITVCMYSTRLSKPKLLNDVKLLLSGVWKKPEDIKMKTYIKALRGFLVAGELMCGALVQEVRQVVAVIGLGSRRPCLCCTLLEKHEHLFFFLGHEITLWWQYLRNTDGLNNYNKYNQTSLVKMSCSITMKSKADKHRSPLDLNYWVFSINTGMFVSSFSLFSKPTHWKWLYLLRFHIEMRLKNDFIKLPSG